ncbi:MAG: hypothetical protein ACHQF2_02375 [Flavobacteriales bacterium]
MKTKQFAFLFTLALALTASLLQSCKKPGDTTAVITVLNNSDVPQPGTLVTVIGVDSYGQPGGRIDQQNTTDGSGKATFNFNDLFKRGAAGFAVLDVRAEKDTLFGTGIIRVEEEKTNETVIRIQ